MDETLEHESTVSGSKGELLEEIERRTLSQPFNILYGIATKIGKLVLLDILINLSYVRPVEA